MRILVVTPKLPWPAHGADEQDRLEGIKLFKEMGHEVRVIAKVAPYQKGKEVEMAAALGVPVTAVPYSERGFSLARLTDPKWLDGAAYEYTEPKIREAIEKEIATVRPDVAWLDASFSWPLIPIFKKTGIRTIVRSLQIESTHILVDEGYSPQNLLRAFGKELGERTLAKTVDSIVAINRNEEARYRSLGAKSVSTVPLRSLQKILADSPTTYRDHKPLHVLFSGSTFSVAHNRAGALRVLNVIAPALEKSAPSDFVIHVTGGKLDGVTLPPNVRYEGYVPDYDACIKSMDVAITPGLGRVGMHQKLYDPVARGIPTVTEPWALAGYPFEDAVALARTTEEFVSALLALRPVEARARLGKIGRARAEQYFSRDAVVAGLHRALQ